jgi:hypothetical protein
MASPAEVSPSDASDEIEMVVEIDEAKSGET